LSRHPLEELRKHRRLFDFAQLDDIAFDRQPEVIIEPPVPRLCRCPHECGRKPAARDSAGGIEAACGGGRARDETERVGKETLDEMLVQSEEFTLGTRQNLKPVQPPGECLGNPRQ